VWECFDNWDLIINEIKNETTILINEGKGIATGGSPGAFEAEFREMEIKLEEVRRILHGTGLPSDGLDDIRRRLEIIRVNLTTSSTNLDNLDNDIQNTTHRVEIINNRIESIRIRIDILLKSAKWLRDNATDIAIQDPTGALNDIRQSYERSRAAQVKVDSTITITRRSEYVRGQVDDLIRTRKNTFDQTYGQNEVSLRELNITLVGINNKIVDLNDIVCDGRGDPCDPVCGGAGCGKCGEVSVVRMGPCLNLPLPWICQKGQKFCSMKSV